MNQRQDWSILILSGVPALPHPLSRTIVDALATIGPSLFTNGITRRVADLSGGYKWWLGNRSNRFRRNLRRARSQAEQAGLTIESIGDDPKLFKRIMAIEQRPR